MLVPSKDFSLINSLYLFYSAFKKHSLSCFTFYLKFLLLILKAAIRSNQLSLPIRLGHHRKKITKLSVLDNTNGINGTSRAFVQVSGIM
ncbi:hypothetical protein [Nostoc sp. 106C]|uniref:hypothetical protein n=1 Tax=Nostoc sp. 106C TaxID=1932667 RepID=UPI000A36699F|nr:hypothetical protein [Nostoc sp. 106C]OUL21664.1 hypothetical protein BV378_26220 [Nostoc sp. RF31YmG]OUL24948.1 hypothetical protein BV375_23410 [Nostoc sp. 106C]